MRGTAIAAGSKVRFGSLRSCDFEASDVLLLRPLRTFLRRLLGELPRWLVGAVRLTTDIIELPLQAITGLSYER